MADTICICEGGTRAKQFRGLVMSSKYRWCSRPYQFEFSYVKNDHQPSQKSGMHQQKIEMFLIFLIGLWPTQTTGDVYDFQFSLVKIIWDSWETVKSLIIGDFPNIWKLVLSRSIINSQLKTAHKRGCHRFQDPRSNYITDDNKGPIYFNDMPFTNTGLTRRLYRHMYDARSEIVVKIVTKKASKTVVYKNYKIEVIILKYWILSWNYKQGLD